MRIIPLIALCIGIEVLIVCKCCSAEFEAGNLRANIQPGADRLPAARSRKAATHARPQSISITPRFLDAVAMVESQGRDSAVGDGGKARGAFQFHAAAWSQSSSLLFAMAHDAMAARCAAERYFHQLSSYLTAHGTPVNHATLYAAWNVGPASFCRRGFSVSNCPRTTQRACAKIERAMR